MPWQLGHFIEIIAAKKMSSPKLRNILKNCENKKQKRITIFRYLVFDNTFNLISVL